MPTEITQMDARDLVGRVICNPNDAEFVVTGLTLEARTGRVLVEISKVMDGELGNPWGGIWTLHDWSVGARLGTPHP